MGEGGRSGASALGEATSSSSGDVGGRTEEFETRLTFAPDLVLPVDLTDPESPLSFFGASSPESTDAEARGLSVLSLVLILLRMDLIDFDEESLVSDFEMEGYDWSTSERFDVELLFTGVRAPSPGLDGC